MKRELTALSTALYLVVLSACGGGSSAPAAGAAETTAPPAVTVPGSTVTVPGNSNTPPAFVDSPPTAKENASFEFTPVVADPDGDSVTFTATNLPSWLSFDAATGTLSGKPDASAVGTHSSVEIVASDGTSQTRLVFDLNVEFDELEQAVRTGDASYLVDEHAILDGIHKSIEEDQARFASIRHQLYALDPDGSQAAGSLTQVSWDPTQDAALLKSRFGSNLAILTSNSVTNRSYVVQSHALGIVGTTEYARYAVFGSNPMRNHYRDDTSLSADMRTLFGNTLDWLINKDPSDNGAISVVLAQLDQSFYFPDQIAVREWLQTQYGDRVQFNIAQSCNGASLDACLSDPADLLIISPRLFDGDRQDQIAASVEQAMRSGTSILYVHHDGEFGPLAQSLLPLFNVDYHGDNYWRKLSIADYDVTAASNELPADVQDISALIERFKNQSFTADLSLCENTSCPDDHPYYDEFLGPAETLQGQIWALDEQGVRLFKTGDYRYQKLLILLGDYYRQRVKFPMDREISARTLFLRSLYADHTTFYNRSINPAQRDLGNFSRSDFSHVTPVSRRVSLTSKSDFRASGAYALPGVPFTVTRLDSSEATIHIVINTLRAGATHQFDEFGYSRPKYLTSPNFLLEPGASLTLTSPHGGPIQIAFDNKGALTELEFSNVGQHPYWALNDDDDNFAAALNAGDYDWAELSTAGFEVHSTLTKMRETTSKLSWTSASGIAEAIAEYTYNHPHVLAGMRGPGIDVVPEIHDFAVEHGLELGLQDTVKHMNADQATCGYGCSGNPYDAYWSFDPLGHGDLHELGHGLERSRFRFVGWDSHASTYPYSYYSKFQYYANTGDAGVLDGCQDLPFDYLFNTAQASMKSADPVAFMRDADLTGWSQGTAIYLQIMMRVQADGALESGWNLLPRLHIVEREFSLADDSDEVWLSKRDGLGFSDMTRTDARRLSNNDWLLIALSHVTGRDLRDYLNMWGLTHTVTAANHVMAMNLPVLPVAIHTLEANEYCLGLDHPSLPVDGLQAWPIRN